MSEAFVGEIRIFGFNFAPRGWAFCNGQLLPISQNTALFSILGTYYGGDGRTTFGLPNLQASIPLHSGQGAGLTPRVVGEADGVAAVTLTSLEMPIHTHAAQAVGGAGTSTSPAGAVWSGGAGRRGEAFYATDTPANRTQLSPMALGISGGSQPHNNMPPCLGVNFCIALQGVFPSRG